MYWKILSWEKGWNLGWDLLCSQLPLPLPPSLWAGASEHLWPLHPSWVTKLLGLISSTSKYLPCLFPLLPSHEVQVLTWNTAGSFWNASPVRDSLLKMFQRLSGSSKTKSKSPHRALQVPLHVHLHPILTSSRTSTWSLSNVLAGPRGTRLLSAWRSLLVRARPCSERSTQINSLHLHHHPLK